MSFIQFQFRRGTAAQWTAANPTLADGEIGIETDSNPRLFKVGDGLTSWASLPYGGLKGLDGEANLGGYPISLSSVQANDILYFDGTSSVWKNKPDTNLTDGGNF